MRNQHNTDRPNNDLRVSTGSVERLSTVGPRPENTTPPLKESNLNDVNDYDESASTESQIVGDTGGCTLETDLRLETEKEKMLRTQELMYENEDGFRVCENVKNAIRVTMNEKLVKNLKFLPKSGASYRMLDFVNGKGKLVELINWLLEEMNYNYSWDNKIRFWNTYNQWIRKQVTNHRSNVSTKLKEKFLKCRKKGMSNYIIFCMVTSNY